VTASERSRACALALTGARWQPVSGIALATALTRSVILQPMSRVALLLALATIPALACEKSDGGTEAPGEDQVDALTRELLAALREGEGERAQGVATPTLAAALDERTVATVGRTLAWLGPIARLRSIAEQPVVGGVERRYAIAFDRGELELTVTVVAGKLEGFEFDEEPWRSLADWALAASAGSLRIAEFGFVDAGGQPIPAPTDPKEIRYSIAVEGLDAQLREHHLSVAKQVFDGRGAVVYRQRGADDIRFPQAETGSSGGRITGAVAVPGPGEYELELTLTDLVGGRALIHRIAIAFE
jgi:hypothetical protein